MDSVSSSFPNVTKDCSPSAVTGEEDDALLVVARLAKESAVLFKTGNLVDCLRILYQLLEKKANDPKVQHNIAIVKTFQEGCSDPQMFIKSLVNIKERCAELCLSSGEQLEIASNNGNKHADAMKESSAAAHPSLSVTYSEEFDTSVAIFNIAVVWYHLHEYVKSFSFLDSLYQNIEPIGEGTALRICLLLLDVALLSHNASRSADVISYMEKVFRGLTNQVDNAASAHQQFSLVSKFTSFPSSSAIPDASQSDSTANTKESSLTRTLSEEALEDESYQLLSSLDISGQNLQRHVITSSHDLPRIQAEEPLSIADLRLKLHLYKVRFMLLTRNLKAAKREVKMAMNIARGRDYPMALYLKAQLEYARGNHRKAIKLLKASDNNTETGVSSMYFNNLGCIYYWQGKHQLSGLFFSKALSSSSQVRKERPLKLLTLSQDKSLLITYNCGVYSLACGRPLHAARCFKKASLVFYNRPLLWLRVAECCLMALEKGLIKSTSSASNRSEIGVTVIGKGKWRQLGLTQLEYVGNDDLLTADGKQRDLSVLLAWQCLMNALYLLDSWEANYSRSGLAPSSVETESSEATRGDSKASNGEAKEQKGGKNQSRPLQNAILDYKHIHMMENQKIKQAALADLAFVELELGNPLNALSTAKNLVNLPDCPKVYIFLGTIYAAEALCMLNQPNEAAEHLMRYVSGGNNVELPYDREDCEKWTLTKVADNDESNSGTVCTVASQSPVYDFSCPEEARGMLCANYAANLALLGDLEQAQYFVTKALSDIPNSSKANLMAIYVDLKRGKTEDAVCKLKQHSGVRFLLC